MMQAFTTKKAAKLVGRELGQRARQLELAVIENVSGTVQVEATTDEIEDFERLSNWTIDSDTIADGMVIELLRHLESEGLLEPSSAASLL